MKAIDVFILDCSPQTRYIAIFIPLHSGGEMKIVWGKKLGAKTENLEKRDPLFFIECVLESPVEICLWSSETPSCIVSDITKEKEEEKVICTYASLSRFVLKLVRDT